jgi:hypothetical protein
MLAFLQPKAREFGEGVMVDDITTNKAPPAAKTESAVPPAADMDKPPEPANEPWWKLPIDRWIALVAVAVAIASAIYSHIDFGRTHEDLIQLRLVFSGKPDANSDYVITLDNKAFAPPKGPVRVEFWTPSVQTQESPKAKPWEKLADDAKLVEFGDLLTKEHIIEGYRRYDVIGAGKGDRQKGTWWIASGKFKFVEFLRAYHEVRHPGADEVYMEVLDAKGGHSR